MKTQSIKPYISVIITTFIWISFILSLFWLNHEYEWTEINYDLLISVITGFILAIIVFNITEKIKEINDKENENKKLKDEVELSEDIFKTIDRQLNELKEIIEKKRINENDSEDIIKEKTKNIKTNHILYDAIKLTNELVATSTFDRLIKENYIYELIKKKILTMDILVKYHLIIKDKKYMVNYDKINEAIKNYNEDENKDIKQYQLTIELILENIKIVLYINKQIIELYNEIYNNL